MNKRYTGLDIVRVFCVIIVCAFHTSIHLECQYGIFQSFIWNGAVLMTTFFMLSGFTLSLVYRNMTRKEIPHYYLKRAISILPMYYICILIHSIVFIIYAMNTGAVQDKIQQVLVLAPIELLGLQSFFTSLFPYNHNGGTWFISCLLFCYILFPCLIVPIQRLRDRFEYGFVWDCLF